MFKITADSNTGSATVTMNSRHLAVATIDRLMNTDGIVSVKIEADGVTSLAEVA